MEISYRDIEQCNAVYTHETLRSEYYEYIVGQTEDNSNIKNVSGNLSECTTVEGNVARLDLEQANEVVMDFLNDYTVRFIETLSRWVRVREDISEDVFVQFEGADGVKQIPFEDINSNTVGDLVATKAQVGHIEDKSDTLLCGAYKCQNEHITHKHFDRADELKSPPRCKHTVQREHGEEQCPSTPHRKMTKSELQAFSYARSSWKKILKITTQKMILTHTNQSDYASRRVGAEVDKPLVGEFEERQEVRIIGRILSHDSDEDRSNSYYMHVLGYEEVEEDELTEEGRERIEEIVENEDPIEYFSEIVGEEYGIQDNHGQIDKARKAVLLSAIKGLSDLNNHNIHTLLGGESGTGKSKVAQSVLDSTQGYAVNIEKATEAGLIGANVQSEELGGKYILQRGAVTQASGGVLLVDEIDKARKQSIKTTLGEAMEEGEVTVSKTAKGKLEADASFIMTSNPEGGTYGEGRKIDSFDIPKHVLDRIDLAVRVDQYDESSYGGGLDERRDSIQNSLEKLLKGDDTEDRKKELSDYLTVVNEVEPTFGDDAIAQVPNSIVRCENEFEHTSGRLRDSLTNISTAIAKANLEDEVRSEHVEQATELYIECWNSMT